jgi:DNA-binding GntR family transcriptional regulator
VIVTVPSGQIGGTTTVSAGEVAYRRLKRMIVTLELPPGTALNESTLIEQVGIGRTPLREALRRLADERLVMIFPRRGMVVAHLGFAEVQQLFEARLTVEGENARLAAERVTRDDDARLASLNAAVHVAQEDDRFAVFLEADQRLHLAIAQIGRNLFLVEAASRLLTLNEWLWHAHMARYGIQETDYASHDGIIAAITRRDPDLARLAMEAHIERSRELLRVTL